MQDLIHNDKQVVTTPFTVVFDNINHDPIDLVDHLHLDKFIDFDFSRCHDCSDNLDCGCVELGMTDLKVVK